MEIVVAIAALAIGIGIGRWTKKGRTLDEEAQSLKDARLALKADPANTEPGDPRRPLPEYWGH
jgi:type II secretory pathway pseudopilin PulG